MQRVCAVPKKSFSQLLTVENEAPAVFRHANTENPATKGDVVVVEVIVAGSLGVVVVAPFPPPTAVAPVMVMLPLLAS